MKALFSARGLALLAACACLMLACSKNSSDTSDNGGGDGTPARVADFAVTAVTCTTADLSWTAPHGGSSTMLAYAYDVRYAPAALSDEDWNGALQAGNEPAPLPPGMTQVMTLAGLEPNTTYAIGLKSRSTAGVWSELSNVATASTSCPPIIVITP